jgi:microsomal epoxide hydrolase
MPCPYTNLPAGVKVKPQPFKVNIPEGKVLEMKQLIKLSKLPPATYESTQEDRRYGVTIQWLEEAKDAWLDFDWYLTSYFDSSNTHSNNLQACG